MVEGRPARIGQVAHLPRWVLLGRGRGATPLSLFGELQHPQLQGSHHRLGAVRDP